MERQAKVRKFKSNPKIQLKTRVFSSNAPAISENHGSFEQNFSEMSKAKRVKYAFSGSARAPIPDVPKTSEYAFFKKLKEDMGNSCHPLLKDRNQIKTANANDPTTETAIPSNVFKFADRKMRSPPQAEMERPTYQLSFASPLIRAESDYDGELNSKDEFRKLESRAPLPCAYVTPDGKNLVLSPFPGVSKISGDEYVGKGIFTGRRRKLRQFVAHSYPELGEGCSKGFDLVSVLLSRLFPPSYENECCQYASSEEREMDATYQLAAPRESYSEQKISTIRNSSKFNFGSFCNVDFPEYWFGSPRKRVISKWDVTNSIDFQMKEMKSYCSLDGEAIEKNSSETDSSCYPCFDSYQSTCPGYLKQMDRFHDPNGFPHTLLLGWDNAEEKEQHIGFSWTTSSKVAYRQTLDDNLAALTMHTSSSHSDHSFNLHSWPYFLSARHRSHGLGIDDEDNYAAPAAKQFLLSTPGCLTMAEDCDNCHEKSQVILYCKDDPYCTDTGSGRKDDMQALPLPGGFTDDLGWKLLPMKEFCREDYSASSHIFQLPSSSKEDVRDEESSLYCPKNRETTLTFPEDAFNIPDWFSSNFHVSLDKLLRQSLLLDNSESQTGVRM